MPSLLLAGLVIVIVGLIDDVRNLSGKQKLLGQIVAASILLAGGLLIERIEVFGWLISFGWFAYPVTLFWLLGAINSLNLLDGIDGLATMLGIILSCTIAAMSVVTGNYGVAIIAMVFVGSLLGFMRYNLPPGEHLSRRHREHVDRIGRRRAGDPRLAQGPRHRPAGRAAGRLDDPHLRLRRRHPPPEADRTEHLRHRPRTPAPPPPEPARQQPKGPRLGGRLLRGHLHGDLGRAGRPRTIGSCC